MPFEFTEQHLKELTENTQRSKSNSHRLDAMELDIKALNDEYKAIYEICASMKTLTDSVVNIKEDVKTIKVEQTDMKMEISEIKNLPYKSKSKWIDKIIAAACGAIGMGILAFILNSLFPAVFK